MASDLTRSQIYYHGSTTSEIRVAHVDCLQTFTVNGDPRLHLFETVVRERGIDLGGRKNVKVEDITVTNTLNEAK